MKNKIIWSVFNFLLLVILWLGLAENVQGALNLGIGLLWISIATYALCINDNLIKELHKNKRIKKSVNNVVSTCQDVIILALILWHGWFILCVFWIISMCCKTYFWNKMNEMNEISKNHEQ
jgi:hypothetical protein